MDREGEIQSAILCEQSLQVDCFVRYLMYCQTILLDAKLEQDWEFFEETSNAFLGLLIIAWCNVFASEKSDIHWSKLIKNMPKEIKEDFKKRLYTSTGLDEHEYQKFRDYIKTIRDKYVAHKDLNWMKDIWHTPHFHNMITVAKEYERWVHDLLHNEGSSYYPSNLDLTMKAAEEEVQAIAALLSDDKSASSCDYQRDKN